jgi:hypothetical protein
MYPQEIAMRLNVDVAKVRAALAALRRQDKVRALPGDFGWGDGSRDRTVYYRAASA